MEVLTVPLIYCKNPFLISNTCGRMSFNGLTGSRCSNYMPQMITMKAELLEIGVRKNVFNIYFRNNFISIHFMGTNLTTHF